MTLLVSVPLTLEMGGQLAAHLDASLEADAAASGVNYDWMQEFSGQTSGVGDDVLPCRHRVRRVLGQFERASSTRSGGRCSSCAAAVLYLALWILRGGRHHRSIREGPEHPDAGVPLGVWGVWCALSAARHRGGVRVRAAVPCPPSLAVRHALPRSHARSDGGTLGLCGAPRAVRGLRDRCSPHAIWCSTTPRCGRWSRIAAASSARSAARFGFFAATEAPRPPCIWPMPCCSPPCWPCMRQSRPGAGSTGWSMWLGFAIGQLYVLARLWVKLVFWASETALFQGRLAHAGYVAAARPIWPESPAAEALGGVTPRTP